MVRPTESDLYREELATGAWSLRQRWQLSIFSVELAVIAGRQVTRLSTAIISQEILGGGVTTSRSTPGLLRSTQNKQSVYCPTAYFILHYLRI